MSTRFGPKHQRKVNECYPQGTGETGAASGKISALCYYINAKPAKLLKVSAYLERKVPRDLARESSLYNAVTLEIVEGIMHGCSDYFATFAPSVLKTIHAYCEAFLSPDLAVRIHKLFLEFCRMTKSVLPSIRDAAFFDLLTKVLRRVLHTQVSGQPDPSVLAKDLQAAVGMEDFRAPQGDERVGIVVNTVFTRLRATEATQLRLEDLLHRDRNRPMTGALELQFGASFASLVESSNSTTIPIIMHSLFAEFDADRWNHPRLCANLLNLLLYATPAQYLCVVLSEIFKKLEKADDTTMVILTDAIAELLLSNRSPLGYSALDLTGNFLKLVRKQKPNAPEEVRSSIIASRVAPPRTIYSICNAFISVLKNANFALQKYEIIESLISKAFFPADAVRKSPSMLSISQMQMEKHSVGTVTLNGTEEGHFRSVVWGILFALAEEGSPPTVLRLAFVEVHVRLFEQLFQMSMSSDLDFCLNTIVLWQQLLEHGLPITPNRRERLSSPSHTASIEVYSLGRTSVYLLTKSRVVIARMLKDEDLSIVHYSAIFSLLRSLVHECDLPQMAYTLSFVLWLHQKSAKSHKLTFDDRACIALFTCYLERDISHCAGIKKMADVAEGAIAKMSSLGVKLIEMSDILDSSRSGPIISGYEEFNPHEIVPQKDAIHAAFLSKIRDSKLLESVKGILSMAYTPEIDRAALPTLQPGSEKGPVRFKQHQSAGNRSNNGAFSRLSQMGGTITSAVTAPAFYRSEASPNGMGGGADVAGMLAPPARTLTVSSSSLAASEVQTMPASIPIDVLDSQFDELSVRVREKKHHKQRKSLLFFGRE